MSAIMQPTREDIARVILDRYPKACEDAERLVELAEQRSEKIAAMEKGDERTVELRNWASDMGMARGAVYVLSILLKDPKAEELHQRLMDCPMILYGVKSRQRIPGPVQLTLGGDDLEAVAGG